MKRQSYYGQALNFFNFTKRNKFCTTGIHRYIIIAATLIPSSPVASKQTKKETNYKRKKHNTCDRRKSPQESLSSAFSPSPPPKKTKKTGFSGGVPRPRLEKVVWCLSNSRKNERTASFCPLGIGKKKNIYIYIQKENVFRLNVGVGDSFISMLILKTLWTS